MNIRVLIALALLGGGIAVAVLLTRPKIQEAKDIIERKAQAQEARDTAQKELDRFNSLRKELESRALELSRAQQSIPAVAEPRSDIPELITLFDEVAIKSGIGLSSFSFGDVGSAQSLRERTEVQREQQLLAVRTISLSFVATQRGLRELLSNVSQSLRIIEPIEFSFSPPQDNPAGAGDLQATFSTFLIPQQ